MADLRPEWMKAHDHIFCGGNRCQCIICKDFKPAKIPKYLGEFDLDGNIYECANGCHQRFKTNYSAREHMGLIPNKMGNCPEMRRKT